MPHGERSVLIIVSRGLLLLFLLELTGLLSGGPGPVHLVPGLSLGLHDVPLAVAPLGHHVAELLEVKLLISRLVKTLKSSLNLFLVQILANIFEFLERNNIRNPATFFLWIIFIN